MLTTIIELLINSINDPMSKLYYITKKTLSLTIKEKSDHD